MRIMTILMLLWSTLVGNTVLAEPVTLRDKIGQMLMIGFEENRIDKYSKIVKTLQRENIGGVILFDYDYKTDSYHHNIENPAQIQQLNHDLQQMNHQFQLEQHRPQLPLLISVDYEGGNNATRLSSSKGFPKTISASKAGKMSAFDAAQVAEAMAETLHNNGFNLDFAPVVDVNVNPENPIIGKLGRSFSADSKQVALTAALYSKAFIKNKVQCAYKHFPGHGSSTNDSHLGFVDVTDTWQPQELEPYYQFLNQPQSCGMIMTAHIVNRQLDDSGLPATLSHKILTGLLRDKMQFKGVIITDDLQMKAIQAHYSLEQTVLLAINAGADMLIFANEVSETPQDPTEVINLIESKVRTGEISEARINDAYQHIVSMKDSLR